MDGNGHDPAVFDQINNALIGDLPSFGAGKESKFQQLMRNNSMNNNGFRQPQGQDAGQDLRAYASFDAPTDADTSLCVEAKEFKPTIPLASQHSFSSTISSFESLNLSGQNGFNQNIPPSLRPNPAAREFVPRNQSAPNLHLSQGSSAASLSSSMVAPTIPGIREFIPSSRLSQISSRPNGVIQQQPTSYMSPPQPRFVSQSSVRAMGDQEMMGMAKSNLSIGGGQIAPGMDSASTNGHSNMFSPTQQPTFYAGGDSDSSLNQSPHPAKSKMNISELKISLKKLEQDFQHIVKTKESQYEIKRCMTAPVQGYVPATSSPYGRQSMLSNGSVGNMSHILGSRSSSDTSDRSSPLQARRAASHLGHRSSPLEPINTDVHTLTEAEIQAKVSQENFGGTTYFFTQGQKRQNMAVVVPEFNVFSGSPPSVEYMKQRVTAPSFFMRDELRQAIMKKQTLTMLTIDPEQDSCFRQVNQKCMVLVEMWKKIQHANIVILREVFTSKAFGEHSLIFSHDYHAGAETLMTRHFQNPNNNYASKAKWNTNGKPNPGLLPESLIWTYIVQLTSALRCIHAAGLACRVMDPTKIIITEKSRYLLTPQQRQRNVNDIMPMIGARFYTQLDVAMMRGDIIENELAKEVENGRLFRLISKLSVINERPGANMDRDWSETGERYLLKLFRDHVFHQVSETGAPWIDMAHIVQCLNKLDAGTPEKLCLMSRDEQNVLVVSYADLKKAFEKCFNELINPQQ